MPSLYDALWWSELVQGYQAQNDPKVRLAKMTNELGQAMLCSSSRDFCNDLEDLINEANMEEIFDKRKSPYLDLVDKGLFYSTKVL